jgi:peptide/nickel transport system permease protein
MQAYILRRLLQALPLLVLVTFATYSLILILPGDPVLALFTGGEATLDQEQLAAARAKLGLDKPVPLQYLLWLKRALGGDLGVSTQTGLEVTEELSKRLPVTAQLGLTALFFSLLVSLPAGVLSAVWRNSLLDRVITVFAVAGAAMPSFWIGMLLILLLSVRLRLLPPVGYESFLEDPLRALKLMAMPCLVLGWQAAAVITRQTRSAVLEVLREDYVRTAYAKGLRSLRVLGLHVLRNALLPVVTVVGLLVGPLLAGAVIVEQMFAIPGVGRLLVAAVLAQDFPTVQGVVLVVALAVVTANLLTDLAYAALDPRIRYR